MSIKIGGNEYTHFDVRELIAVAAKGKTNNVCDKMRIIGVTGTNGKTTSAFVLAHLIGRRVGVIGTLGAFVGDKKIESESKLTTPDPIHLHEIFQKMYDLGVRTVVMEVSAHAIFYRKVAGINFESVIFTNLTQDHLDFFGNITDYANTKIGFVLGAQVKTAIVNADDPYGQKIISVGQKSIIKFSIEDVKGLELLPNMCRFRYKNKKIALNLCGRFNVYNALGCICAARALGISMSKIRARTWSIPVVAGRFNVIRATGGYTVVIDYAHTPDGLEKILNSARELVAPNARLVSVFGCGGNRDTTKREIMGKIAGRLCDYVVITSDNPRNEIPEEIIKQIEGGIMATNCKYHTEVDRRAATIFALDTAQSGDVIVIAGKGAETTQEIAGVFYPYVDGEVVGEYLNNRPATVEK
jgi:UDP-N-acetylmuramoyl-L-alanyl-D-glutamate--2,6-diaminopimelate ligase